MITSVRELIDAISQKQLLEHIQGNVELKESWERKHGEKLSALGNKIQNKCGWLVVGVDDDGNLCRRNIEWAKSCEEIISQHLNDKLEPIQSCKSINCVEVDGSWIIVIEIRNPGDIVYWGKEAYGGTGTTIKILDPDQIIELRVALPGLLDYSAQPVPSVYDGQIVSEFTESIARIGAGIEFSSSPELTLRKIGIHSKQASRILFGQCTFRVVKFNSANDVISNATKVGLFTLLTDKFQNEIQEWSAAQTRATINPYPPKALKEALANSVAHAAYYENDGEVIIELYPEKLCVSNLCHKEASYFANKWFSRSHKTFNGLLMEVLRISGKVDELGRGKNLIFSESIKNGKMTPEVVLENAGGYKRWKLWMYGNPVNKNEMRLLGRIREYYKDEQKALIAYALALWKEKPVNQIKEYVDGDFARQFAEVLDDYSGPIFYYKDKERIVLNRWARLLLGEGLDSKKLSPDEESRLREHAYRIQVRYYDGFITPKELRKLGDMQESRSERVLSSQLLTKWEKEGVVTKIKYGTYKFVTKEEAKSNLDFLMSILQTKAPNAAILNE